MESVKKVEGVRQEVSIRAKEKRAQKLIHFSGSYSRGHVCKVDLLN